VKKAKKSQKR